MARKGSHREAEEEIKKALASGAAELDLAGFHLCDHVPESLGGLINLRSLDLRGKPTDRSAPIARAAHQPAVFGSQRQPSDRSAPLDQRSHQLAEFESRRQPAGRAAPVARAAHQLAVFVSQPQPADRSAGIARAAHQLAVFISQRQQPHCFAGIARAADSLGDFESEQQQADRSAPIAWAAHQPAVFGSRLQPANRPALGSGLSSWWKLLFGLVVVAAGMGCFDCVGSSFGRSYFAQHDRALRLQAKCRGSLRQVQGRLFVGSPPRRAEDSASSG